MVASILVAGILGLYARTFLVQVYKIPSDSMTPGLLVGDLVLVDKFVFGAERHGGSAPWWLPMRSPRVGDVVTFHRPARTSVDGSVVVKRCVALPGDTVRLVRGALRVNGRHVDFGDRVATDRRSMTARTLPLDQYFVLGDQRVRSIDSRVWGGVRGRSLIGRPFLIYSSFVPRDALEDRGFHGTEPHPDLLARTADEWGKIETDPSRDSGTWGRLRWRRCFKPVL